MQVTFLSSTGPFWHRLDRVGHAAGSPGFHRVSATDISGTIPAGTTSAVVTTTFADRCPILGHYNDAYADNVSFTVGDPSLTPAQLTVPTSNVGQIDHVQVIYMENKGVGNIIGSPNAPYINSLINSQDYVSNYYALGHPSDPNYFRVMGGSDFGLAYNPVSNVINAPSLMQEMDRRAYRGPATRRACPSRVPRCRRVPTPPTHYPSSNSNTSSTTLPPTCRHTCSR